MPPLLSASTVVASMPPSMAQVPSASEILPALRPPSDQDIPDAPDADLAQTTPQGPTAHSNVPAAQAREGPRFPPSSQSTHPETVKLVQSSSSQPNLAAPLPRWNLFGAGSTHLCASTSADWSRPAPSDVHKDL